MAWPLVEELFFAASLRQYHIIEGPGKVKVEKEMSLSKIYYRDTKQTTKYAFLDMHYL